MITILAVDDEQMALQLVELILTKRGYKVLSSTSPLEALEMFEEKVDEIDLLVSDVRMPELNGPSLANRIAQLRPDLPVLFISGYVDRDELERAEVAANFAFLRKPFQPAALVQAVHQLLTQPEQTA